jgi:protease-4
MNQQTDSRNSTETSFEQNIVNRLVQEILAEQRRARRWGVFFKSLLALYLFALLVIFLAEDMVSSPIVGEKYTALVEINGLISADTEARADYIVTGLRDAFENNKTAGVIVRINSPGGSPVQAGYINDEIVRLRAKYPDIPLYAVISDICASGGYYIAAAADKIYANKASIVGSIGVVMASFGYVDAIKKLGIERRLLHAGENKGFLDPFTPLKEKDVAHVDDLLVAIHRQFINVVKQGRGKRIKEDDQIFSGLIWTGEQSVELGLVDALGSASYVAREIIGAEEIVDFTKRETVFDRFANRIGAVIAEKLNTRFELR